jgi:hypothetical protein
MVWRVEIKMEEQTKKLLDRVRRAGSREGKARWKNALRASPDRLAMAMNVALARASHTANLPTGQITTKRAAKIDAVSPFQLDMFGG